MNENPEIFERWISGLLVVVAVVDLLSDACQAKKTKDFIETEINVFQAHFLAVVLHYL